MATLAVRDSMALWMNNGLLVVELREQFAQFGHTGFHRGMGWIQFSSKELHNLLVQAQKPKALQGNQTSDEEKDF
ncbi:hypothetical protein FD754_006209 [Muntiacus muntjak]|uniref:Uncharacterized protein n=1 Tax=Muntiacus muntjak TaxID=9888 RepID=A0A5N3WKR5_MUNMU|nr:hypothetical protein FD754_006209 [Muntiacus muntjak]